MMAPARKRRGSRAAPEPEAEEDVEVVAEKPKRGSRGGGRKRSSEGGGGDGGDGAANKARKFKLYQDATTGRYETDPFEGDGAGALGEVKDKDKEKAEALDPKELAALVSKMARYMLLRGSKKAPIVKAKVADAVMGDYKKLRITTYVFGKARDLLRDAWGYELAPAPPSCGDVEFRGQAKDAWYLVYAPRLRSAKHAALAAAGLPERELAARGVLMAALAMVQAHGGAIREKELYRMLSAVDPRLPDEPTQNPKSARNEVPGVGNVAALLDEFKAQHYVVASKDTEDEPTLALGPRALVDVGRYQITQFQADALGHAAVDAAMIQELADAKPPDAAEAQQ